VIAAPQRTPPPASVTTATAAATSVTAHDQFWVDTPLIVRAPLPRRTARPVMPVALMLVGTIAFAIVAVRVVHPGAAKQAAPTILSPRTPTADVSGGLAAATRMQAESSRRFAIQAVEQLGADEGPDQLTLVALGQMQPGYRWITGSQASTAPSIVSFDDTAGVATVAVSTASREVCAFGRFSPDTGASYVTMAHLPQCRAIDAPTTGWSTEPGGAPSDLPDETG
jgi:hypothetical protein